MQALADQPRVGMVLGETLDIVAERIEARGRDDPRLAHGASEEMLVAAGLRHPLS